MAIGLVGRKRGTLTPLLGSIGTEHNLLVADINSSEGRNLIAEHCTAKQIDIVINCAGVLDFGLYEEQSQSSIEAMVMTNMLFRMLKLSMVVVYTLLNKIHFWLF